MIEIHVPAIPYSSERVFNSRCDRLISLLERQLHYAIIFKLGLYPHATVRNIDMKNPLYKHSLLLC